ncbi:Ral guanine nucleotide dissociation stimulator, partial [Fukomys damarensis]
GEKESSLTLNTQACFEFLKNDVRETMVNHLVPSLLQGNSLFLHKFLQSYQAFGTMQQVLDLLLKSAISTILGTWLEKYSDQFWQPPEFECLKQLVEYVKLHMAGSDLEHRAQLLLAQLENMETVKAKSEALARAPEPVPTGEQEPALAAASKPAVDTPPILQQESAAVPAPVPGVPVKPPRAIVPRKKLTVSEMTLELQPARAGPLLPVVPPWPSLMTMKTRDLTSLQQGKKAQEHQSATIHTPLIQLPNVAQCVISTVLRHCIMETSACTQERQRPRNLTSLSGLRISAIQCLMENWEDFSRWLLLSIGPPGEPAPQTEQKLLQMIDTALWVAESQDGMTLTSNTT